MYLFEDPDVVRNLKFLKFPPRKRKEKEEWKILTTV
jgi:hypothetical protein